MEKTLKVTESSELYRKINALGLTPAQRAQALATLAQAETLADSVLRLLAKLHLWGAGTTAPAKTGPSAQLGGKLKHQ